MFTAPRPSQPESFTPKAARAASTTPGGSALLTPGCSKMANGCASLRMPRPSFTEGALQFSAPPFQLGFRHAYTHRLSPGLGSGSAAGNLRPPHDPRPAMEVGTHLGHVFPAGNVDFQLDYHANSGP